MKIFISIWFYENYQNVVDVSFHLVGGGHDRKYETDFFVTTTDEEITLSSNFSPNFDFGDKKFPRTTPTFYRKIGRIIYKHRIFSKEISKDYENLN